jgi:cytidylate kinase
MKKIIIAIDGFSSTGKSTLARQLAQKLNYTYIDSGAMYRVITWYFLKNHIALSDDVAINNALQQIEISFQQNKICLNGTIMEDEIRKMEISNHVSEVSALAAVRNFAVAQQQLLGQHKGIVMDGRDIGTTVFPDADLKIYLFANEAIRTQRRYDEMLLKDKNIGIEEVALNLQHRDHIDSTRAISPLRMAHDAIKLDNSHYTMDEQLQIAYQWALEKINVE